MFSDKFPSFSLLDHFDDDVINERRQKTRDGKHAAYDSAQLDYEMEGIFPLLHDRDPDGRHIVEDENARQRCAVLG